MTHTKLYKLTSPEGTTRRGERVCQWGPGATHSALDKGPPELCSGTVVHAYRTPLLAVLMAPTYGCAGPDALLWEAEGDVVVEDGTKVGCRELTTLRQVDKPVVTTAQRVRFAILCAQAVGPHGEAWDRWAEGWLSGEDRAATAAATAARAARAARAATEAARAARAAAEAAARAARAARARAAEAAWAAWAAWAALAALAAARAARAAAEAALAAAWAAAEAALAAAWAAEAAAKSADFAALADRAVREEQC